MEGIVGLVLLSTSTLAHHGAASLYDVSKEDAPNPPIRPPSPVELSHAETPQRQACSTLHRHPEGAALDTGQRGSARAFLQAQSDRHQTTSRGLHMWNKNERNGTVNQAKGKVKQAVGNAVKR